MLIKLLLTEKLCFKKNAVSMCWLVSIATAFYGGFVMWTGFE